MRFTASRLDALCFSIPAGAQTMNDLVNASSGGLLVHTIPSTSPAAALIRLASSAATRHPTG